MRVSKTPADGPLYGLMTALVVPRPIAWVGSLSASGVHNLAPHSFFTVVSADPAMVLFTSVGRKDTLNNIEATGEFVINVVGEGQIDQANQSSAPYPPERSEVTQVGIAVEPSDVIAVPRVSDSPAAIECHLEEVRSYGDSFAVVGRVVNVSVREDAISEGRPDFTKMAPVARLGGPFWALPGKRVSRDRPWVAD